MNGYRNIVCRSASRRTWTILRCLIAAALLVVPLPSASAQHPEEYQVKAAFLLNFTKFMEWQPAAFTGDSSSFHICILGEDPFGPLLEQITEGEMVGARKIDIRRLRRTPPPGTCHVLFVSRSEKDVRRILLEVGPNVLTVGEGDFFLREGGIVAFVLDDRRVRFDINQAAAEKAMVSISSRLLKVARSVTSS